MQDKKQNNTQKKESVKSLGKLINIMVWDDLCEHMDGLTEAEIIDHLIENYELDGAANLERRGMETKSQKAGNSKQANPIWQSVRGQVRRTLKALGNIEDYLDIEGTGNVKAKIFEERYGVKVDERNYKKGKKNARKIYKLHSKEGRDAHKLTDDELRILMFLIWVNQSVNGKQASSIITKLLQHGSLDFRNEIGSSFVGEDFLSIYDNDWDKEFINEDYVMENVALLQKVIQKNYKNENNGNPESNVAFEFYAYDENLRLRPSEEILGKARLQRVVTPLKVFSDTGRFFVYVAVENWIDEEKEDKPWKFYTYRVDLMRDMVEVNKKDCGRKVYIPTNEQREELRVGNIKKYLNMSFSSETEEIRFLFLRERITAIVDSFGRKNVKIIRFTEQQRQQKTVKIDLKEGKRNINIFDEEGTERVLCRLETTSFGFVDWAMQYSDFIEVLEPRSVVDEIKKKARKLAVRYGYQLEKGEKEHE